MRHESDHQRKERSAILERMRKWSRETQARALQTLNKIAQEKDPEALFVATLLQISFHQGDNPPSEATHGSTPAKLELLAYHLFPKFQSGQSSEITPSDAASCIKALEDLFSSEWLVPNLDDPSNELSIIAEVRRNAEVVRGSAYPEQTISRINEVQGVFEARFSQMLGIGPKRAHEFVWAVAQAQERHAYEIFQNASTRSDALTALWEEAKAKPKSQRSPEEMKLLQSHRRASDAKSFFITQEMNNLAVTMLPVGPEDLHVFDVNPSPEEWTAFSRMIGLTVESRSQMSSSTDVRRKSLFVLSDGRVLLSEISNLLDNLWEEFEGAAKGDSRLWQRYLDRRTAWLEGKVFEILSQIFSPGNVYRNLSYPDPDQPDKRTAELDFAVLWGPFLVLIEAKGGQFRLEGQLNDPGRLRTDLKKNVEDAFGQAQRAAKYIETTPSPVLSEINSARTLRIPKEQIRKTYLLSVSLHNLGVVSTRLATLREIGLLREGEYPFSISVADLEMIGMFCEGPEIFLHYVERRLVVQKHQADVIGDELDLWGAYLDTRLQAERIRLNDNFSDIVLTGYSEQLDNWVVHQRGEGGDAPEIRLNIPEEIRWVLHELHSHQDFAARWIAFAILDMNDSLLKGLGDALQRMWNAQLAPDAFRVDVLSAEDIVISLVGSLDQPLAQLEERTDLRVRRDKYNAKVSKGIGFGIQVPDKSRPFLLFGWKEPGRKTQK